MRKTALITGITGQDGSYLAEFLLEKGYEVHGIVRRASSFNTGRIEHIFNQVVLHYGDLVDTGNLCSILSRVRPDEVYNLAAQSHVKVSFELPEYTGQCDGLGTMRMLEALRTCGLEKCSRFLPGIYLRTVWKGAGNSPNREDALLSALSLRRRQNIRILGGGKLPRGLRDVRVQRNSFQP